ncbi:MAG: electron transport complex subunit RsxC [Acidobacteria bacterium]|nr:MAG: electron transport complex subunit RsxC [Acidobacteriota bacterium]
MTSQVYEATKTFSHGVHPPEYKDTTKGIPIRRFPFAPIMLVPLSQHIGAPARAVVREGQEVSRGQIIARAGGFVSVPMHAPATGVVRKIAPAPNAAGNMVQTIFIEPYPGSSQQVAYGYVHPVKLENPQEIINAVQNAGMVGMGGAAFPTHVKLQVPKDKTVDTLVINGVECEPYLTTDHRVMLEQKETIFKGIQLLLKASGAQKAIVGIEANKPDAIAEMKKSVPANTPIEIEGVKVKYPQGAEKMLIKALLNREVPSGGLPFDIGVLVSNVATASEIGELVPLGQGMIERVITITGPGVEKPGNYKIPMGTTLRFIMDYVGLKDEATSIILGGPMMGSSISSLDIPITKGVSGIVVLTERETVNLKKEEFPCIKCGHCLEACPIFLNPSKLGLLAKKRAYKTMADSFHLMDCFECGSCSFVCPSNIPLVHHFRVSKGILREEKKHK